MEMLATTLRNFPSKLQFIKTEKLKKLNQGYLFESEVLLSRTFSDNTQIDDVYIPIVFMS